MNQKHLQVFQAFCFLKNTKETRGDTQKTKKKLQVFVAFLVLPELYSCHFNFQLEMMQKHFYKVKYFSFVLEYCFGTF